MASKIKKFDDPVAVADVISSYRDGESCVQIGARLGVDRMTINAVLRRNGVHLDQRKVRMHASPSEEIIQKMIYLYAVDKLNTHQIAKQLGVGSSTVVRYLNDRGVTMRSHVKRHKLTPDQRREAANLYIDECYSRHPMSGQVEAFKDEHVFACEVICG